MKKIMAALVCLALCPFIFGACGETKDEEKETEPATETVISPADFQSEEDFVGTFKNEEYTAHLKKNADDEMEISIKSAVKDGKSCEWTMSGYFSTINYKVICDNTVKTIVTYNSTGKEKSRETEYKNGSCKIVFSDSDHFIWENGMEEIGNNAFTRTG